MCRDVREIINQKPTCDGYLIRKTAFHVCRVRHLSINPNRGWYCVVQIWKSGPESTLLRSAGRHEVMFHRMANYHCVLELPVLPKMDGAGLLWWCRTRERGPKSGFSFLNEMRLRPFAFQSGLSPRHRSIDSNHVGPNTLRC
jgi:hypothetical protein